MTEDVLVKDCIIEIRLNIKEIKDIVYPSPVKGDGYAMVVYRK